MQVNLVNMKYTIKMLSTKRNNTSAYLLVVAITLFTMLFIQSCTYDTAAPTIDCSGGPTVNIVSVEGSACGTDAGRVELSATGGTGAIAFSLDGTTFVANSTFEALAAGNYTVTARDENGCTGTANFTITNADGLNVTVTSNDAGCGTQNGSINVTATGGTAPFTYQLNSQSAQNSPSFNGLAAGSYTITTVDDEGCEVQNQVEITSGVSFQGNIANIISTNCAISGCHNGTQSPDFRNFSNIQNFAERIRVRTGNRSMPRGRTLTDAQIAAIDCWVTDGALDN